MHLLLQEFKISFKSSLSTQSFCHTVSPRVGVGVPQKARTPHHWLLKTKISVSMLVINCVCPFSRCLSHSWLGCQLLVPRHRRSMFGRLTCNCVLTIVQHRFILINFLLFSAAVQFCKGRYTNTSLWLWLWLSGLFCGRPGGLELVTRLPMRSKE